jgi:hypothetical protein
VCQEERILITRTKHVECDIALCFEVAPVGDGERFWKACHAGKKLILPCAYGTFGRVCVMDVWGSVLDASLFRGNKRFEVF